MNRLSNRLSNYKFYQFLHRVKNRYIEYRTKRITIKPIKRRLKLNKNAALYIFTPTHSNLGDHAITYATEKMFDKAKLEYLEIPDKELYTLDKYKALNIFNGRKIIMNGGGYLGTIWIDCENLSRKIVESNPYSKIFFLPNTIFYEKDENGKKELDRSIEIYNNHKKLVFYAREKTSYEFMKNVYSNVKICPDMVLSLEAQDISNNRKGCLICLRSDIEKTLDKKSTESVLQQVEVVFNNNYSVTDMYASLPFDIQDREKVLQDKFDQFRKAELVITDRLHGMIFSAVTGTSCIVLNSKSPKVKGCYEWIKDLGYIRFCDGVSELSEVIKELSHFKNCKYSNSALQDYYTELMKDIKL